MMYRPDAYAIDSVSLLHETMRRRSFATIAAIIENRLRFAYAPVIVDSEPPPFGSARFHLARGNPLSNVQEGSELRLSFLGPDAYVSPDWYARAGFVPTWNYIAVEGAGPVRLLDGDELRRLVVDLSAEHEGRLVPKPPWTLDRILPQRLATLFEGIRGFALAFESLQGKFKLSQDKSPENISGVIAGLEGRGDGASVAVAEAMRAAKLAD